MAIANKRFFMAHEHAPRLEPHLFHPRYWGSWIGLSLLWLLVLLPWRSQMWLGRQLGTLARVLLKSRVKIARRNLELAMPELTEDEREKLLRQNLRGKSWFFILKMPLHKMRLHCKLLVRNWWRCQPMLWGVWIWRRCWLGCRPICP